MRFSLAEAMCDPSHYLPLAIAAEEAKIGDTHARWGLRPTWGMSASLPRRVGFNRARELSFTAGSISGKEAARIGLVNRAVPADKLEEVLRAAVDAILANSAESVAAYKSLARAGIPVRAADETTSPPIGGESG